MYMGDGKFIAYDWDHESFDKELSYAAIEAEMRQHMIEMTTEEITKYANMYNDVLKDTILDWLLSRRVT